MKLITLLCLIGALSLDVLGATGNSSRVSLSLDHDWRFELGFEQGAIQPEYNDRSWRHVDVPHDYAIEGAFELNNPFPVVGRDADWYSLHGFLPIQPATYRRSINLPAAAAGKQVWLEFDGVFSNSHYWLNGRPIGSQYSGYARSRFDVTNVARFGEENILTVEVDPRYDGWWYEGAGIYRHVRMVLVDPLHISPDGIFVTTTLPEGGNGEAASAAIQVETATVNSRPSPESVTILEEVFDDRDRLVASARSEQQMPAGSERKVIQHLRVEGPKLWAPDHPALYRLRTTIRLDKYIVDQVTTPFGIRSVRFDAEQGFFLNGKRVEIQGVNMHEDHAGVGVAIPDRLFTWRLERLKEVGCNAIRLSHNPVEPFLLDECDRLGFLVIAENRHLGDTYADQTSKDTPALKHLDLSQMVLRDRNHPSIILWSLCNEQWIQGLSEAAKMAAAMKARIRELDPTRPVTAAMNGGFDQPDGLIRELDVVGVNYHPDVYQTLHRDHPKLPMIATEIASELSTRGVYTARHWDDYYGDREKGHMSAYSVNAGPGGQTVENAWPPVAEKKYISGAFVWAGFDYKGEPRPLGWPQVNSNYGFMDICGFPKDSYYYYKAWWTNEPVLHVFPHWNWAGKEGAEIPVWIDTNCEEVELFLNGVSLGKKKTERYRHLEWKVKYAPGQIRARGLYQGKYIEDSRTTTGDAKSIQVSADRRTLTADNTDLAIIKVEIFDRAGRLVPTADNKVSFTLEGPGKIIGVGNGDPSCHEPDKASSRSAFNGLAQVIIQTTSHPGEITLHAKSEGLESATLKLVSR